MDPRGTIGFELRELSILSNRFMEKEKISNGLDDIQNLQGWALGYLYKNRDKTVFPKDIEKEFFIRKSTASNLIKRMQKNGYIDVKRDTQEDKRLKQLVLTDKAIEQIKAFEPCIERLEEKITKDISPEEIEQFKQTLIKIKANFDS